MNRRWRRWPWVEDVRGCRPSFLGFVLLAGALAVGPLVHADDHGDDRASATRVEPRSETDGVIDPGDDEDWFHFEVVDSTVVTTIGSLDTVGHLYDAEGNLLHSSDDTYRSENFSIVIYDRGTYYVRVTSFEDAVGTYTLLLGPLDHGDSRVVANRVELPSKTYGTIDDADINDWFRFEVAADGEVTIATTGRVDTYGWLYDSKPDLRASNDDAGLGRLNFRIRRTLFAGVYYVRVDSLQGSRGLYVLHLRQDGADDDHGNSTADATAVALPSSNISARIDPAGDEDWFRLEPARAGNLTASARVTSGDLNLGLVLAERSHWSATDAHWELPVEAGTHYLVVKHNDSSYDRGTGDYALELFFDGDRSPSRRHLRHLGDFNGDGRDDVLLRHMDGRWYFYPMDGRAVLAGEGTASLSPDLAWQVAGIGDFDGDGKDDVLLRHMDGRWYFYPMDGRAVLAGEGTASLSPDLAWQVAGIGDFDDDGKDDVLLRHEDGRWHYYRMNGRSPLSGSGRAGLTPNLAWQVAGVGDFDGDGRADVLLRREEGRWYFYPMDGRAPLAGRGTVPLTSDLAWAVAGMGDFDADGRHDVLLRHTDGRWRYYPMQGRRVLDGAGLVNLTGDTTVGLAGIGDLNGDGRADVLARLANGGWLYYALDGRRVLSASGEAALSGNRAWSALSLGQAPTLGATLLDRSVTLGRDETIDLAKAFVDDQTLTYEARSSNSDVVRASVDGDGLTLSPAAEGMATVTVRARDPEGNSAMQTFAVSVAESTFRDCAECPLMVRVPAGMFMMGSPESEPLSSVDEGLQRSVSIPAFAAGAYEVTFAEWDACVAANGCDSYVPDDAGWGRGNRPAITISWDHARSYVDWLSRRTDQRYRLLTESEWEYAARADTTTPFHTGGTITPQQANFDGRWSYPADEYKESGLFRQQTVPFGSFAPNGFGLYDMHGNVWELVLDPACNYATAPKDGSAPGRCTSSSHIIRGGSWATKPSSIRSAARWRIFPTSYYNDVGFRVARSL